MGARARFCRGAHRRRRPGAHGGALAGLARRRVSRRDGIHGQPRHEACAPGRTGAGHGARHQRAHELPAAGAGPRLARTGSGARRRSVGGRDLGVCARPRLPQGDALATAAAGRTHQGPDRRLRLPRVQRFGARDGSRAGRQGGAGLARQAHLADQPPGRLLLFSRRDPGRCAAAGRCARNAALRPVLGLHQRLPDAGHPGAAPARRAPLHLLPDDRTEGRDSASRCAR